MADESKWRSEWLRGAEGATEVARNGRPSVLLREMALSCLSAVRAGMWAYDVMYEPLSLMRMFPLRAEKYFLATVLSVCMIERAFAGAVGCIRHLHRHAILACYLDAVADTHDSLRWPIDFGMAVFGKRDGLPVFMQEHCPAFRDAVTRDFPLLVLAARGENGDLIVSSLLDAAAVELDRKRLPAIEHKLMSNMTCIRPFIAHSMVMDASLLEPLAMIYTFFDDAMDVMEDGASSHMSSIEGVERAAGLVRRAVSEINASAAEDWSNVAESSIELARLAALAQICIPDSCRNIESAVPAVCVIASVIFFALYRTAASSLG